MRYKNKISLQLNKKIIGLIAWAIGPFFLRKIGGKWYEYSRKEIRVDKIWRWRL